MGNKARLYDHTVRALRDVIAKQGEAIRALQAEEKIPHAYSLGFVNALIFTLSRLEGRRNEPNFFQHDGVVIAKLPKPTHYSTDEFEPEAQARLEAVLDHARVVVQKFFLEPDHNALKNSVEGLETKIRSFDLFIEEVAAKRDGVIEPVKEEKGG